MFIIVPVISIGTYIVSVFYEDLRSSILNAWFLMYPLLNVLNIFYYYALMKDFATEIQGSLEDEDNEHRDRL